MVAEGAFRLELCRVDGPDDAEVRLGHERKSVRLSEESHAMTPECACEGEFAESFGERHHGCQRENRRAADEDVDTQRFPPLQSCSVMDANAAMDLIMESDFLIRDVVVSRDLDAVHAEVRALPAGVLGVFGIDSGESDKWSSICGP